MRILQMTKKEKIKDIIVSNRVPFGICLLLITVNVCFYFGVIAYQDRIINGLQVSYSDLRKERYGSPNAEKDRFVRARKELINFERRLSSGSDLVIIATDLKNKLQQPGISVGKMTFKPEKSDDGILWKFTTSVTLSGHYENLKRILADIYNSPNLYCIDRLAFYNSSDNKENVDLSLSITMYYHNNGKS